jgi:hypothetical protein
VLATAGAAVVLVVVGLAGVLIFTRTTPRVALTHLGTVARPVGGGV